MATAEDKTRTAGSAASTDSSAKAAGVKAAKKATKKAAKKTTGKATKQAARSSRRNRPGPRQRLLASATNLFTTQGIRVIGIDRILRDADVAKASLYSLFGSKDNLVVAYLQELDQKWRADWHALADQREKPEDRIIAFFDLCIQQEPDNNFRGSHFQNAASEYPRPETDSEQRIRDAAMEYRRWCRDTMAELLTERFGYASQTLADQLMVFMDGGLNGAKMSRNTVPLETARGLAKQLLLTAPMSYNI
ncbi:TetR/AcrR family transcriptional regulator [uncultured Corynebacterium sp.]|uniref:TetR/AcrR family transcriptional regulator n=1 Tax=uncultured Corynebacterium sp. TaxID=159447 RepID=UPI0025F87D77|nr:TetR/AcrR family transcriptional regulator [uncultured Corynebacterium sp.]